MKGVVLLSYWKFGDNYYKYSNQKGKLVYVIKLYPGVIQTDSIDFSMKMDRSIKEWRNGCYSNVLEGSTAVFVSLLIGMEMT